MMARLSVCLLTSIAQQVLALLHITALDVKYAESECRYMRIAALPLAMLRHVMDIDIDSAETRALMKLASISQCIVHLV